jgi:hypothetical protein
MTSLPSPPNRRRRRIVITVIVLAVGLCWWYYPRGDARFVGKWRKQTSSASQVVWTFVFNSNGSGYTGLIDEAGRTSSSSWFWSVEGDVLSFGTDYGRWDSVAKWLSLLFDDWTGTTFEPIQSRLQVLRIDSNMIELRGDGANRLILNRIPE